MNKPKDIKEITAEYMKAYISENDPQGKDEFLKHAFVTTTDKKGNPKQKYVHFKATRYFCGKYMEELLPKKKSKKGDVFANW